MIPQDPQDSAPSIKLRKPAIASLTCAALLFAAPTAHAVDGCLVLLCLAAPSWRAIPQCVLPVRQVLRDLALGKVFPTCGMSGPGNTADHTWAAAPSFCPPQYTRTIEGESQPTYLCDFAGAVSVSMNGLPFSRTWWSFEGTTVTEFFPEAKRILGSWDTRFDDDYAAWILTRPGP